MRFHTTLGRLVAIASISVAVSAAAAQQSTPGRWTPDPATRVQDWQEDIDALLKELPARHKNAFFQCTKEQFAAAGAELRTKVPDLKDHEVVVGLMKLTAMIGDSHTGISHRELAPPFHAFPIAMYVFSDGPVIIGVSKKHADLIGCTLVSFGGVPWEDAFRKVAVTSAYENQATFMDRGPRLAIVPEIAQAVGLIPTMDKVTVTVRDEGGKERTVDLVPLVAGENTQGRPGREVELPLYRQKRDRRNWFEPLPEHRALYLRYDTCSDEPGQSVAQLAEKVLATIDAGGVERVIVDLRSNGGGNSALLAPLTKGLKSRAAALPGGVRVLIGRFTFSSAEMNAVELKQQVGARLIGEPTGQKPNHYGELKSFVLPHSKITVRYSTKFWKTEAGDRPSLEPDQQVLLSSADYFAMRDPVLDAVTRQ